MSEIRSIAPAPVVAQPNADVIQYLEVLLAHARCGKLQAVITLAIEHDAKVSYTVANIPDRFMVLGLLSHIMHQLNLQ